VYKCRVQHGDFRHGGLVIKIFDGRFFPEARSGLERAENEAVAYAKLQALQGSQVPWFGGLFKLNIDNKEVFAVILEKVEGILLTEVMNHVEVVLRGVRVNRRDGKELVVTPVVSLIVSKSFEALHRIHSHGMIHSDAEGKNIVFGDGPFLRRVMSSDGNDFIRGTAPGSGLDGSDLTMTFIDFEQSGLLLQPHPIDVPFDRATIEERMLTADDASSDAATLDKFFRDYGFPSFIQ